jgi:hypothetical protein
MDWGLRGMATNGCRRTYVTTLLAAKRGVTGREATASQWSPQGVSSVQQTVPLLGEV